MSQENNQIRTKSSRKHLAKQFLLDSKSEGPAILDARQSPFNKQNFIITEYFGKRLRVPLYKTGTNQDKNTPQTRELMNFKFVAAGSNGKIYAFQTRPTVAAGGYVSNSFDIVKEVIQIDRLPARHFPLMVITLLGKKNGTYKKKDESQKLSDFVVEYADQTIEIPNWTKYVYANEGGTIYASMYRPENLEKSLQEFKKDQDAKMKQCKYYERELIKSVHRSVGKTSPLLYKIKHISEDEITKEEHDKLIMADKSHKSDSIKKRRQKRESKAEHKRNFEEIMARRKAEIEEFEEDRIHSPRVLQEIDRQKKIKDAEDKRSKDEIRDEIRLLEKEAKKMDKLRFQLAELQHQKDVREGIKLATDSFTVN